MKLFTEIYMRYLGGLKLACALCFTLTILNLLTPHTQIIHWYLGLILKTLFSLNPVWKPYGDLQMHMSWWKNWVKWRNSGEALIIWCVVLCQQWTFLLIFNVYFNGIISNSACVPDHVLHEWTDTWSNHCYKCSLRNLQMESFHFTSIVSTISKRHQLILVISSNDNPMHLPLSRTLTS